MEIRKYTDADMETWDRFVSESKNGNFHLQRKFVAYHKDRIEDYSLLIYDNEGTLLSVLPGCYETDSFYSHKGLIYGGFIQKEDLKLETFIEVFSKTLIFLKENGFIKFYYKTIPHIYHKQPAEEDLYLLYLVNAQLIARHVNPVIPIANRIPFQERRRRAIKKAINSGIVIKESDDIESYWMIITELLNNYNTKPVHDIHDITYLRDQFSNNIRLIAAFKDDKMLAGILFFESEMVAKMQYIGSSEEGKQTGALDLVFSYTINELYHSKPYIDFGTSTTHGGDYLSIGISNQKEGFGARTTIFDQYMIDIETLDLSKINNLIQ